MKRIQFLAPILGLALCTAAGCEKRDRDTKGHLTSSSVDEKRKTSIDDDINAERARLDDERYDKSRRVDTTTGGANERYFDEDDDRDENVRKPVAGRREFAKDLQDKLGTDWSVEKHGKAWVAVRRNIKKADDDMRKKVNNEIKELKDDHKDLSMLYQDNEMILRGSMKDCDDTINTVDKFSDIDGINRIIVELSCARD